MSGPDILPVLGARILRARTACGWSVREMARKSGVSFSAISRAENAVGDVNVGTVARLADVLGIPLSDLLAAPSCAVCDGKPPDGYTCNQCGRSAP